MRPSLPLVGAAGRVTGVSDIAESSYDPWQVKLYVCIDVDLHKYSTSRLRHVIFRCARAEDIVKKFDFWKDAKGAPFRGTRAVVEWSAAHFEIQMADQSSDTDRNVGQLTI